MVVKPLEKCVFSEKTWISMPLEIFLWVGSSCLRYLTGSPNIALSAGEKIKVIRYVYQKILKKNQIFGIKKKVPRAAL